jgi:hypothetical protein
VLLAHAEQGRWRGGGASSWWCGTRWGEGRGAGISVPPPPSSSPSRSAPTAAAAAAQLNVIGSLALRDATGATPAELASGRSHRPLAARLEREAAERREAAALASARGARGALARLKRDASLAPFTVALVVVLLAVFKLRVMRGGESSAVAAAGTTAATAKSTSALPFPPPASHATRLAAHLTFFLASAGLVLFTGEGFFVVVVDSGAASIEKRERDGVKTLREREKSWLLSALLLFCFFNPFFDHSHQTSPP